MPRKAKRDDLAAAPKAAPAPVQTPNANRQPRILGWLVLIAGASSTWYWYRPLPPTALESAHSTVWPTSEGPPALRNDQALIVPSTVLPPEQPFDISSKADEAKLIGPPPVALIPWNETKEDIRDVLKTEHIPPVPIEPPSLRDRAIQSGPIAWTPDRNSPALKSPTNLGQIAAWPDVGYQSPQTAQRERQRAATRITTQIPQLLETGMKSIRTTEDDEPRDRAGSSIKPTLPSDTMVPPALTPSMIGPDANRTPQFIRQPKN